MYKIHFRLRKITINKETDIIIELYQKALDELKTRTNDDTNNNMNAGETKLINTTLPNLTIAYIEEKLGIKLGATVKQLDDKIVYLSPIAHKIYIQYRKFLTKLLLDAKGVEIAELTEQIAISNKNVLVREILLRLTAEALCINNEGNRDGLQIITTIDAFVHELKTVDVFVYKRWFQPKRFTEFAEALFLNNKSWLRTLESIVDIVKQMNRHRDTLSDLVTNIGQLRRIIIFRIMIELVPYIGDDIENTALLTDDYVMDTLLIYENKVLQKLTKDKSCLKEIVIHDETFLSERKLLIELIKKKNVKSTLDDIYQQFLSLNELNMIADKINSVIEGLGWFAFLSGSIDFTHFVDKYNKIISYCLAIEIDTNEMIKQLDKLPNLKMGLIRHQTSKFKLERDWFKSSDCLLQLNNPDLLKSIAQHFQNEFHELLKLSKRTSCQLVNINLAEQYLLISKPNDTHISTKFKSNENIELINVVDDEIQSIKGRKTLTKKIKEVISTKKKLEIKQQDKDYDKNHDKNHDKGKGKGKEKGKKKLRKRILSEDGSNKKLFLDQKDDSDSAESAPSELRYVSKNLTSEEIEDIKITLFNLIKEKIVQAIDDIETNPNDVDHIVRKLQIDLEIHLFDGNPIQYLDATEAEIQYDTAWFSTHLSNLKLDVDKIRKKYKSDRIGLNKVLEEKIEADNETIKEHLSNLTKNRFFNRFWFLNSTYQYKDDIIPFIYQKKQEELIANNSGDLMAFIKDFTMDDLAKLKKRAEATQQLLMNELKNKQNEILNNISDHQSLYKLFNKYNLINMFDDNVINYKLLKPNSLSICSSFFESDNLSFSLDTLSLIDKLTDQTTGDTLLHFAVRRKCLPIIECLLKLGASPYIENNSHESVISMAAEELKLENSGNEIKMFDLIIRTELTNINRYLPDAEVEMAISRIDSKYSPTLYNVSKRVDVPLFNVLNNYLKTIKNRNISKFYYVWRNFVGTCIGDITMLRSQEFINALIALKNSIHSGNHIKLITDLSDIHNHGQRALNSTLHKGLKQTISNYNKELSNIEIMRQYIEEYNNFNKKALLQYQQISADLQYNSERIDQLTEDHQVHRQKQKKMASEIKLLKQERELTNQKQTEMEKEIRSLNAERDMMKVQLEQMNARFEEFMLKQSK